MDQLRLAASPAPPAPRRLRLRLAPLLPYLRLALVPVMPFALMLARPLAWLGSAFFTLLGLGAIFSFGLGNPGMSAVLLWGAGLGLLATRAVRQRLA